MTTTTTMQVLDPEEATAVRRLVAAVYTSKIPIAATVAGVTVTRVAEIPGADDVVSVWPVDAILDPMDIYETVMADPSASFTRRNGVLVCTSQALVARVVARVVEEADRLGRAQTLPKDGWRHYRRTRELPARRRHVASLAASVSEAHPYVGKPFDPSLRLPGGAMVLRIMEAYRDPVRPEQIVIIWDVAEGYYTNCYSNLKDPSREFLHRETINCYGSSEQAKDYKIEALDASNPGLDARELLVRGDFDGLSGRRFGGVFRLEDYTRRSDGEPAVRAKLRYWIPVDQVPTAETPAPLLRHGYVGPLPSWPDNARGWD